MLVGHILIQHFFHDTMPTWNWMSLWNWVGYNAILTDTRQLLEKTFSAVQDLKPALFSASSLPSQQARGSQDQGSRRSASLVAWSCRHLSCGCDETQVVRCSEALHVPPPWVLPPPPSKAQGCAERFFKNCWLEIWVFHAMPSTDSANPLLWLGVASYLPWTYKFPSVCLQYIQ